jgi:hypothetical protein
VVPEQNIILRGRDGDTVLTLRIDDGQPAEPTAFTEALAHPSPVLWTGAVVPLADFEHLDFWLCDLPMCRVLVHGRAASAEGLPAPAYDYGSMGLFAEGSFAYLTRRPADGTDPATGRPTTEIGIAAFGPGAAELAGRFAERVRAWRRELPSVAGLRVDAYPAGGSSPGPDRIVIDKRHVQLRVRVIPAI